MGAMLLESFVLSQERSRPWGAPTPRRQSPWGTEPACLLSGGG